MNYFEPVFQIKDNKFFVNTYRQNREVGNIVLFFSLLYFSGLFILILVGLILDYVRSKQRPQKSLGDKMKKYESSSEAYLDSRFPIVVRLDGKSFSRFTRGLTNVDRPFSNELTWCFMKTAEDLMDKYSPNVIYTQSDEISMVFMPKYSEDGTLVNFVHNGRIQKLASLMAGFSSGRFNHYLRQAFDVENSTVLPNKNILVGDREEPLFTSGRDTDYKAAVFERMNSGSAYFDGRIWNVPTGMEALNSIYWRAHQDCVRNSVSNLARFHFSTKELYKMNSVMKYDMLLDKGVNWNDLNTCHKYGVFLKKQKYLKETDRSDEPVYRTRSVFFQLTFKDLKDDGIKEEMLDLVRSRYLEEDHLEFLAEHEKEVEIVKSD